MDRLDRELLERLRRNARMPFVKMAEELGVSEGTIRSRVRKLETMGIIRRFTVITDFKDGVEALVNVKTSTTAATRDLADAISQMENVDFTFEIMGETDILTLVKAASTADLDNRIEDIRKLPGVENTTSSLILRKYY